MQVLVVHLVILVNQDHEGVRVVLVLLAIMDLLVVPVPPVPWDLLVL